jgi:hypothetical protein
VISDAEKLSVTEVEVSGLRSLLGDTAASAQKVARDIHLMRAAVTEQRMAHDRNICALEEEIGGVPEAIAPIGRPLGQEEGRWREAVRDLQEKSKHEPNGVSRLNEVLGNLESQQKKLWEIVAGQGDEQAGPLRWNSELGGRVQQLEGENRLLRESSEGLKGEPARVEAGQQSAAAHLQEAITAVGSKVKEDLSTVRGHLEKMKEEIELKMITAKQFPRSMKNGKIRVGELYERENRPLEGEVVVDVPDGISAHLMRKCRGNVHDRHVLEVTSRSFEKENHGANRHSGAADGPIGRVKGAIGVAEGAIGETPSLAA